MPCLAYDGLGFAMSDVWTQAVATCSGCTIMKPDKRTWMRVVIILLPTLLLGAASSALSHHYIIRRDIRPDTEYLGYSIALQEFTPLGYEHDRLVTWDEVVLDPPTAAHCKDAAAVIQQFIKGDPREYSGWMMILDRFAQGWPFVSKACHSYGYILGPFNRDEGITDKPGSEERMFFVADGGGPIIRWDGLILNGLFFALIWSAVLSGFAWCVRRIASRFKRPEPTGFPVIMQDELVRRD